MTTNQDNKQESRSDGALDFLKSEVEKYPPFTHGGLNQLPNILYPAVAKAMEEYANQKVKESIPKILRKFAISEEDIQKELDNL